MATSSLPVSSTAAVAAKLGTTKHCATMLDPFAWIVLQLPRELWDRADDLLRQLRSVLHWNILTGEVTLLLDADDDDNSDGDNDDRKPLAGSNIVDILHHALRPGPLEPVGYKAVCPFLPKGCTKPIRVHSSASAQPEKPSSSSSPSAPSRPIQRKKLRERRQRRRDNPVKPWYTFVNK
jgi:hypothetical protein